MASTVETKRISTKIPARMDRLPWSRFHWRILLGLGTVWALDGLEVTMVSSVASRLTDPDSGIDIGAGQIGLAAAFYIVGACLGALFFGQLTDRFGRKRLFIITLVIYIVATVATAFAFAPWYFYLARLVTGAGIGGEYAAINSAIDELIPARARGRVDLIINGTYWFGAAAGAAMALALLNTDWFPADVGWRLAFGFGAVLGLAIMLVRRNVPESPRWLFIHGREEDAERIVQDIESDVSEQSGERLDDVDKSLTIRQRTVIPFRTIARTAFKVYPKRSILGLALFVGQAFIYNGVTFNLGTLFSTFYGVASGVVPLFIIIWALSNFAGPVTLGRLFDTVGRIPMIVGCYVGSAALMIPLIVFFVNGTYNEWAFLINLMAVFFLASAGASAAYLTVSEIFPIETRALAIAFFYAVGTAAGGIIGPILFGSLVGTEDRGMLSIAFIVSAAVMTLGGIAEMFFGVRAEKANLEDIATPLTAEEAAEDGGGKDAEQTSGQRAEHDVQPEARPTGASVDGHRNEARRLRKESELMRARAAEHRAAALGEPEGSSDAEHYEVLAEAADLRAGALEEQAAAADELAEAERADGHDSAAARARSQAAEQRARMLSEREETLAVQDPAEAAVHEELAEAAAEWSRAREQHALAEQSRSSAVHAQPALAAVLHERAGLNEAWAGVYEARAQLRVARTQQDESAIRHFEQQEATAERAAMDAEQNVAEAEQHSSDGGDGFERRISERRSRRRAHERSGLRRLRPGPGSLLSGRYGGLDPMTAEGAEEALDREIEAITAAVDEHGPTDRNDLARLVGARYWGPGRFAAAVRTAVNEGRIRRVSRRTYAPPETDS